MSFYNRYCATTHGARAAEDRLGVFEKADTSSDASSPPTTLKSQMAVCQKKLAKYEQLFETSSEADVNAQDLLAKFELADGERSKLALQLRESQTGTTAVYAEVVGLSKQWEKLNHLVSSNAFEVRELEQERDKYKMEKAKADNKFFAVMRLKEALEAEAKLAHRSAEKQMKQLERATEVEKSLAAQIVSLSCRCSSGREN